MGHIIDTPASKINRYGLPARFADIPQGAVFECNGNVWVKRSTRTATGIWPACLPEWAYFRAGEIIAHEVAL